MSDAATLPRSQQAEEAVLGSLLSMPDSASEVIGTLLEPEHFYFSPYRIIYERIVEAHYGGEAMDPITIGEGLGKKLGQLWKIEEREAVDRVFALTTMPIVGAGRAVDHAGIVKKNADMRALLRLGQGLVAAVQAEEPKSPEEIASEASTQAMQIATDRLLTHEILSFADLGKNWVRRKRQEIAAKESGVEIGAYFGYEWIDGRTKGFRPGELMMAGGEPGVGKALALDTPLPTPNGWTTMGAIRVGRRLLDERGQPCTVVGVTGVMERRPCYRLWFSDGSSIVADAEHQWMTANRGDYMTAWRAGREAAPHLRTTAEIYATTHRSDGGVNHGVQLADPLALPRRGLLVDPYVLGAWLGDGTTSGGELTCADHEIISQIEAAGYKASSYDELHWKIHGLGRQLGAIGVKGEKFIPMNYLRASDEQRLALLQGLVDTDGHVSKEGRVEITLMNDHLALGVAELAVTLGMKVTLTREPARLNGRIVGERQRIRFLPDRNVARLPRKCARFGDRKRRGTHLRRYIVKVEQVESVSVRCVQVSSPSSLYLAGESFIPTHNSAVWFQAVEGYAGRQQRAHEQRLARGDLEDRRIGAFILSMEMGEEPSSDRIAQGVGGVDGGKLREVTITRGEVLEVAKRWASKKEIPFYFNHSSAMRASQMRALIAEAIKRHNCGLILIDHFRYFVMDDPPKDAVQHDEEKAKFLKQSIARDLNVAVICIAHTHKSIERVDKRPRLSDLRGSGQIGAEADFVNFVYRPYQWATERQKNEGAVHRTDAELIWSKARHGLEGTDEFYFNPSTMSIGGAP